LQKSPLEGGCVVVALVENYTTSKPLKVSPEKSQILSCDTVVANERYVSEKWTQKRKNFSCRITFTFASSSRVQTRAKPSDF